MDEYRVEIVREKLLLAFEQAKVDCRKLAELGWTVPMHCTLADVREFAEAAKKGCVGEAFWEYYHSENHYFFDKLQEDILSNETLDKWKLLLKECFEAYRLEKHLIVIPSLITVIDGLIAQAGDLYGTHLQSYLREKVDSCTPDSLTQLIWISVCEFIKTIFSKHEFNSKRPLLINRHWILHGRDIVDWNRVEALRLFIALHTISQQVKRQYKVD